MRLEGKRAFITGAGGGIGRATALRFAAEGAKVAAVDIVEGAAKQTVGAIEAAGGQGVALVADVADQKSCAAAVEAAERELGGLDILFNNAGIVAADDTGPVETPLEAWQKTLAVNLTGVFLCCKFGIPALERAGGGSVVNTASVVAHVGSAYPQIAYTASKGGVVAMTREMAIVYGRKGIRFNAISPGLTETEMTKVLFEDEAGWRARRRYMPMGRMGTVDEVANLALFLASDESSYITGQSYVIDGGVSAAYVIKDD